MAKSNEDGEMIPELSELQSMKVTDLKKKLKAFGLPITGNKTELVERLQDAYLSVKDISASSDGFDSFDNEQLNFDGSQGTELEPEDCAENLMEESLLDQDQFSPSENSSLQTDATKVLDHASVDSNLNSANVSKPLKKRVVVKSTNEATGVVKKIHLNRTSISFTELNSEVVSSPKTVDTEVDKDESNIKKLSLKNLSESERLAVRAKRFNIASAASSTTLKTENSGGSSSSVTKSGGTSSANMEILKKRAQRFGQNVSTVMKQLEEKERLLKRKLKFGASVTVSATSTLDEHEKKKRRAERFGIS